MKTNHFLKAELQLCVVEFSLTAIITQSWSSAVRH